jgi:uncharacterized protein YjdB
MWLKMSAQRLCPRVAHSLFAASLLFVGCTSSSDDQTHTVAAPHAAITVGREQPAQLLQHAMLAFRSQGGAIVGGSRTHHAIVRDGSIELTPYTFEHGERTAHGEITLETAAISVGASPIASAPAAPVLANGGIELQRGSAVERLRNDVDGLHQEWSFASTPGSGDLVVEVALSGYTFSSATQGGLHFAGDGVLVRYSHALWSGKDGRQWPISARYDAATGRVRMTVPAGVIAATQFPALLDPTVSAEVAADSPVVAPTGQTQQQEAIAFGGGEYLAVWSDYRDSNDADIWGTRLASDGTVLDTLGLQIAATSGVQSRPAVAFDGTAFVVAYEDFLVTGGTTSNVKVARVATDGTVTAVGAVTAAATSQTTPNVASAGGGAAMIAWNTGGAVDGAIVTSSVGATIAIATGAVVERPSIASNPAGDYLVGYTVGNNLMGQLVAAAGTLDGAAITISAPPSGAQTQSDATFDGTNYDVVWRSGADAKVYGTRVSTAGTVLDTRTVGTTTVGGVAINAAPAQSFVPTISCLSAGCLVAWQDQRTFATTSYDIYGQLLTLAFAKSGTELALSAGAGPQTTPRLASNGTAFFMAWTDNRNNSTNQIYGATVSATGTVGTQADIATGNNRESGVTIGTDGTNTGMFWRDSRGGPSIYDVRYDSAGNALDTTGTAVEAAAGAQGAAAASAALGGHTLVVWDDTRNGSVDIYGARVDLAAGTTLDASGIAISTAASNQLVPRVASNGTVALVVWQDFRNGNYDVYGALIDSTGAITLNDIPVSVATGAQDDPVVTWDATSSQFIVVWQDSRSGTFQLMGTRVDAAGSVLDSAGVAIATSTAGLDSASIASSATNTLAIWRDANHVRGARLTGGTALSVLDATGIALSSTASNQSNPQVGMLGGSYLVVWSDDRAGNQDIYGQVVGSDGTLHGTDFGISTSTDDEVFPNVMATSGSAARVAYEARRLDTSRAVSRVVTNAIESIAVTPASPTIPKGTTQQFTATATFSDGSTGDVTSSVTWSSSNTAVATIASGGLATAVATGTSTITATSGAISGSTVLTVAAAALTGITVTPASTSVAVGYKTQFIATGTYSDGSTQPLTSTVVWASSNTSVATISNMSGSRGQATGVAAGTVTISATQSGFTGTATLMVTSATLTSIAVTPATANMLVGAKRQFHATGTFSDGTTLELTLQCTWTSSDSTIASTGSNAVVSAVALGTATISATKSGITGTSTVNVVPPSLVSITISPQNPYIAVGQTQTFTASGKFNDGSIQDVTSTVTWASSNTAVATMSANVATAVAAGTTTISATSGTISASTTMTVSSSQLVSIAVTPSTANVPVGYKVQFIATGTFADGSTKILNANVTFASSNMAVATISNFNGARGVATVLSAGTTTITATLAGITGSATLNGTTATLSSIAVTPATNTMSVGQSKQLHATATFSDATTLDVTTQVTWSSSDMTIATIGSTAVVKAVAVGSATISATKGAVTGTASVTVP